MLHDGRNVSIRSWYVKGNHQEEDNLLHHECDTTVRECNRSCSIFYSFKHRQESSTYTTSVIPLGCTGNRNPIHLLSSGVFVPETHLPKRQSKERRHDERNKECAPHSQGYSSALGWVKEMGLRSAMRRSTSPVLQRDRDMIYLLC